MQNGWSFSAVSSSRRIQQHLCVTVSRRLASTLTTQQSEPTAGVHKLRDHDCTLLGLFAPSALGASSSAVLTSTAALHSGDDWKRALRLTQLVVDQVTSTAASRAAVRSCVALLLRQSEPSATALAARLAADAVRRRLGPMNLEPAQVARLVNVAESQTRQVIIDDFNVTADRVARQALIRDSAALSGGKWQSLLQLFADCDAKPLGIQRVLGRLTNGHSMEWRTALGLFGRVSGSAARRAEVTDETVAVFRAGSTGSPPSSSRQQESPVKASRPQPSIAAKALAPSRLRLRPSAGDVTKAIMAKDAAQLAAVLQSLSQTEPLALSAAELTNLLAMVTASNTTPATHRCVAALLSRVDLSASIANVECHQRRGMLVPAVALLERVGPWGAALALCQAVSFASVAEAASVTARQDVGHIAVNVALRLGTAPISSIVAFAAAHNVVLSDPRFIKVVWQRVVHIACTSTVSSALVIAPPLPSAVSWSTVPLAADAIRAVRDLSDRLALVEKLLQQLEEGSVRWMPVPTQHAAFEQARTALQSAMSAIAESVAIDSSNHHVSLPQRRDVSRRVAALCDRVAEGEERTGMLTFLAANRLASVCRAAQDWRLALHVVMKAVEQPSRKSSKEQDDVALAGLVGTALRVVRDCEVPPWRLALRLMTRLSESGAAQLNPQLFALGISAIGNSATGYTNRSQQALWWAARARACSTSEHRSAYGAVYGALIESSTSRVVANEVRGMHRGSWADASALHHALRDLYEDDGAAASWLSRSLTEAAGRQGRATLAVELCGGNIRSAIQLTSASGGWHCAAALVRDAGREGLLDAATLGAAVRQAREHAPAGHAERLLAAWSRQVGGWGRASHAFAAPVSPLPLHCRREVYEQQEALDEARRQLAEQRQNSDASLSTMKADYAALHAELTSIPK